MQIYSFKYLRLRMSRENRTRRHINYTDLQFARKK